MKTSHVIVILIGLLVLGLTWFVLRENGFEPAGPSAAEAGANPQPNSLTEAAGRPGRTNGIPSTAAALPRISLDPVSALSPEQETVRNYRDAPSAGAAHLAIEAAWAAGLDSEASWAETQLAGLCEPTFDPEPPGIVKARWAWDALAEYCADWDESMVERAKEWHQANPNGLSGLSEDLAGHLKDLDSQSRREFVLEFIREARTPQDLAVLLDAVMRTSHPARPLTDLGQDANMALHDFRSVLGNAVTLMQCRMFGGCGSQQPVFLQMCAQSGSCQPGFDMAAFMTYNTAPYHMEQALQVTHEVLAYLEGE